MMQVKCDQCEAVFVNGVPCHETGCIRSHLPWVTIPRAVLSEADLCVPDFDHISPEDEE